MTFPLTIRSAFSLEWSKTVNNDAELLVAIREGLELSPIGEVLIRSSEPHPDEAFEPIGYVHEAS